MERKRRAVKGRAAVPENLEGPLRSRVVMVVVVGGGGGCRWWLTRWVVGLAFSGVRRGERGERERESARHFDGNSYSIV